jgi:hypothetical protein
MIAYVKSQGDDGKKHREYRCARCGVYLTESGALLNINGATEHSYINPAGIRCNFMTFLHCENVLVHEDLYIEHSWFPRYGWRFLMCQGCFLHLGWKYDSVEDGTDPEGFFGMLIHSLKSGEIAG